MDSSSTSLNASLAKRPRTKPLGQAVVISVPPDGETGTSLAPPLPSAKERQALVKAFVTAVEERRVTSAANLDQRLRVQRGQFFTPSGAAEFLATFPRLSAEPWRLLDPGAGVGSFSSDLHARIADLAEAAEGLAADVALVETMDFKRQRKQIRDALAEAVVLPKLDDAVASLIGVVIE